jgi:DNA-binding NarL/FixJ family response regulator
MTRILIADDHLMFIKGLKMLLSTYPQFEICAVANNGLEVMHSLQEKEIDLILMDINMPQMNGYDATLAAMKQKPDLAIIALSMLAGSASVSKMLEAGARGYIIKNTDEEELVHAIQTVAEGGYYVIQEYAHELKDFLYKQKHGKLPGKAEQKLLTARETEILERIIEGDTNIEIAEKLFLSNRTVDTHRKNILAKLNLKNTAALVHYALENKAFLGLNGA